MRERLAYKHEELDWPSWVPGAFALLALITGVSVIVQRQASDLGLGWPAAFAALVLAPFALEGLSAVTQRRLALPRMLFPVPVLVGMVLLLQKSTEVDFAPFVLVLVSALMAAESGDRPAFGIAVTVASCAVMVQADIFGRHNDSFIWVVGIVFGWFGGFSVQTLATKTADLKRANDELAERSATEERQRIAREIHDVIAHSMSVSMLHITAARMALERDRSADALDALREAEEQGRRSLNEIRRTVGLLGPHDEANAAPMPTTADLPALIEEFRAAGLSVDLTIDGDVAALPPASGLNVYRIVQESLTNVAKHAPGAKAAVELRIGADIRLRVRNALNGARSAAQDGLGIRGMSERAELLGGTIDARAENDAWTVELVAPRPDA